MSVDYAGYSINKSDIIEICAPRNLCDMCGLNCSLEKLLPFGKAWVLNKYKPKNTLLVCEPFNECPPCETRFFNNWFSYRSTVIQDILNYAVATFQELNPLTSTNPSYWVKRYKIGIKSLTREDILCKIQSNCVDCTPSDCSISQEAQLAIDYNLLRAYLRITRNDFGQNLTQWNSVLSFLGLALEINTSEINNCEEIPDGQTYVEQDFSNKKYVYCENIKEGETYNENNTCKIEVLRLRLVRYTNYINASPIGICGITNDNLINVISDCNGLVYDPLRVSAMNLINKYWLLSQPVEII